MFNLSLHFGNRVFDMEAHYLVELEYKEDVHRSFVIKGADLLSFTTPRGAFIERITVA